MGEYEPRWQTIIINKYHGWITHRYYLTNLIVGILRWHFVKKKKLKRTSGDIKMKSEGGEDGGVRCRSTFT